MPHTVRSTLTDAQIPEMERCERRIGYAFRDKSLLTAALTHASGPSIGWLRTSGSNSWATPSWGPSSANCSTASIPTTWKAT